MTTPGVRAACNWCHRDPLYKCKNRPVFYVRSTEINQKVCILKKTQNNWTISIQEMTWFRCFYNNLLFPDTERANWTDWATIVHQQEARVTISLLFASLINALLAWSVSLGGRPSLDWSAVVSYSFHFFNDGFNGALWESQSSGYFLTESCFVHLHNFILDLFGLFSNVL